MMDKEKSELILKLFDRQISIDEFQRLQDLMRGDSEMKDLYFEHALLEHSLSDLFGGGALLPGTTKRGLFGESGDKKTLKIASLAAVACLVVGLITARLFQLPPQSAGAEMRFSDNSVWSLSGGGEGAEGRLSVGNQLVIESGAVELSFAHRVTAIIEGPAKLRLEDEGILNLYQGRGSFTVPAKGVGFTVVTPRLRVVDLGTQFGVSSDWEKEDEVHVIKGSVTVDNLADAPRLLHTGDAVSVDSTGEVRTIACWKRLYQGALPHTVEIIAEDDFEGANLYDGQLQRGVPSGWTRFGETREGFVGVFNPSGDGRFYDHPALADLSDRSGMLDGMRGGTLGYFYEIHDGGIERNIGSLSPDSVYTVTLHLGVRAIKVPYAGYSISLMSGNTVVQTINSATPPCGVNQFKAVTLSWDSADAAKHGIRTEDPMIVRISPYSNARGAIGYLDFDDFRTTVSRGSK